MKENDQRLLESMILCLSDYREGFVKLPKLIFNLEVRLNSLEGMPETWIDAFREDWGTLEVVYSISIVYERPSYIDESREMIDEALSNLQMLIENTLSNDPEGGAGSDGVS